MKQDENMTWSSEALHESQRPGTRIGRVLRPGTWAEAIELYDSLPEALPTAGATDLLLDLARKSATLEAGAVTLIDLWGLAECSQINIGPSDVIVGCGVTHNQIIAEAGLDSALDLLRMACLEVGSPQLRNRATVVGNIVTASPANDTISALVALDATVMIESLNGQREVPIREFFTGFRSTTLRQSELVRAIRIPRWTGNTFGTWLKIGNRSSQAISVVHAGVVLELDESTLIVTRADAAIGSVSETITLSTSLRESLVGKPLSPATASDAAQAAADETQPIDDIRATANYRRSVTVTALRRALLTLVEAAAPEHRTPPLLGCAIGRAEPPRFDIAPTTPISCVVNGTKVSAPLGDNQTVLQWIRSEVATGTKEGCAEGECGACTIKLNGAAVMSCLVPSAQADGSNIVTVEGLASSKELHSVQKQFLDNFAVQCGFCTPGFLVAASTLHDELESPTEDDVRAGLAGNLCRCTGYYSIVEALTQPSGRREKSQ